MGFTYRGSFRKASDPVSPISSVLELPTTIHVKDPGASVSQNSQWGDDGVENSGKSTGRSQRGGAPPHDQVEDESQDPSDDEGELVDRDEDPDNDNCAVPDDDEIVKG